MITIFLNLILKWSAGFWAHGRVQVTKCWGRLSQTTFHHMCGKNQPPGITASTAVPKNRSWVMQPQATLHLPYQEENWSPYLKKILQNPKQETNRKHCKNQGQKTKFKLIQNLLHAQVVFRSWTLKMGFVGHFIIALIMENTFYWIRGAIWCSLGTG